MAYGDFIYIAGERNAEERLLQRLEPLVAAFVGSHELRVRRGSGWVLLATKPPDVTEDELWEALSHPKVLGLTDDEKACQLSRELGADVLHVGWVSSLRPRRSPPIGKPLHGLS